MKNEAMNVEAISRKAEGETERARRLLGGKSFVKVYRRKKDVAKAIIATLYGERYHVGQPDAATGR